MLEADAKAKFGIYSRCSETPCYTVTTGSAQLKAYCFRQGTTTTTPVPSCPVGCSCISEATAKARGGTWSRCSVEVCGYEQSTATLAAVVNVPKYCMKQETTTPLCPVGCTCLTDADAKERYGDYSRCSADVCGYELSATANALAATQVPKYCVKQGSAPVCPDNCACISDEDAKLKGLTDPCDTSRTPCGYRSVDATTASAAQRISLYCYKLPTTTTTCPPGCNCLSEAKAKERYGTYTRCSEEICGKEVIPAANGVAAYSVPQFCVKQGATPVCPQGCYCLQEAEATLKFGTGNYTRCSADVCGYDPSATTANGIPKYCFKPVGAVSATAPVCPQGCTCTTNATAAEKGLTFCGGILTPCGYNEDKQPLYCFKESPATACIYDYQKNTCTGTCDQGYTCGLKASKKDATGKVVYAVCGCTGQPATPCAYDALKNACTGTCQTGVGCSVVGKNVDEKTGATTLVCGCPQQTSCSYNYDNNACAGTCTVTGENCQLNTIYRDPATGKVTYGECYCKGGDVTQTCACDAASGSCTGTCADGAKACTMVEKTTDASGKVVCSRCDCRDTCVLNADNTCSGICLLNQQPCARIVAKDESGQEKVSCGCGGSQPVTPSVAVTREAGIFEVIGSFFSKLFGGK
jgi:hypothetical protein